MKQEVALFLFVEMLCQLVIHLSIKKTKWLEMHELAITSYQQQNTHGATGLWLTRFECMRDVMLYDVSGARGCSTWCKTMKLYLHII